RGERINYARVFRDVRLAIDEAHADGAVHRTILSDLPTYIDRDPLLARTLHKLRSAGKRLFLLTNSPWAYTDAMMTYLLGSAMNEYKSWQQYFDIVICAAKKPLWFAEGTALSRHEAGGLQPASGPFEKGKIYEGGNLKGFEQHLGVPGSAILYVGDHIYGDILRSKKESAWRTAMIIQELDAEIGAHETCIDDSLRQRDLDEMREKLEDELRYHQGRYKELSRSALAEDPAAQAEKVRVKRSLDRVRASLRSIDTEHAEIGE